MKRILAVVLAFGVTGMLGCAKKTPEEKRRINLDFLQVVYANDYGGKFEGIVVEVTTPLAGIRLKRVVVERADRRLFNAIPAEGTELAVGQKVRCDYVLMRSDETGGTLGIRLATPLESDTPKHLTKP